MESRPPLSRRHFMALSACPALAAAPVSFPAEAGERTLIPLPAQGAEVAVNPPGFAWWRARGAAAYRLIIEGDAGALRYEGIPDPVFVPPVTLAPGKYRWDVEACDKSGRALANRGWWEFTVPKGLPELPWVKPETLLARLPAAHPRYILTPEAAAGIRRTLESTRRAAWTELKKAAEKAMKRPLPKPPEYHTFATKAQQRMGYKVYFGDFRDSIDSGMGTLALVYAITGEERYGLRAKQILLEVEKWGVEGPMSLLSEYGDEPGLSMSRFGHRAYDWLYALFDEDERRRVRKLTTDRARQILRRLRRADYLFTPAESHNGRLIAYLGEHALVLNEEAPDSAEWLDYSLRALMTFYPHWGGQDGGWAEGISYALAYNTIYTPALEALRANVGLDLYKRPFFRNVRYFFLYATSPIGEIKPFGDGAERGGVGAAGASLMMHLGRRFQDPACIWYARQTGAKLGGSSDPLVAMITEDNVAPQPPAKLPAARVFRGVGWAALHSALDDPQSDTLFLLKSSPYGSVSHSHADQNSFAILKGGKALAIPSGYYGPAYGMPHHAEWTRQTKANNSVLVNGEGQLVRSAKASGRIAEFRHEGALTYVCGDATPAYGGKLTRFHRHVLFLRPGVFLMVDDLAAPQASRFQWLMHAFDRMEVNEAAGEVISRRKGASLAVRLFSPQGLALAQKSGFDTPFNEGNPAEYHQQMADQWHFRASTQQAAVAARIAAAMVVRDGAEAFRSSWTNAGNRFGVSLEHSSGAGEVWLEAAASGGRSLHAVWKPKGGREQSMTVTL